MADKNLSDKRQKLIEDAVVQCQETRKFLERTVPHRFEQLRSTVRGISKQEEIRSSQEEIRSSLSQISHEGSQKTKVVETIQKYLELSTSNPTLKNSIKALLSCHRH